MGNTNGREEGDNGSVDDPSSVLRSIDADADGFPMNPDDDNGDYNGDRAIRVVSVGNGNGNGEFSDSMVPNSPPASPGPFRSPLMFAPQLPVAPLQRGGGGGGGDAPPVFNQMQMCLTDPHTTLDLPPQHAIPTMITWSSGGTSVLVEGSWDNWTSRPSRGQERITLFFWCFPPVYINTGSLWMVNADTFLIFLAYLMI
ncbi:hypothetical protein AQUCO_00900022v1 [Aquilegia coerulea]|uniref:AMP-activated protein kinase glycogen-binding domain-containing protein n=1 Tax=Aquilegia coerulea TaxID=218851 RepID=A0A2G5EBJ0_AQUCA|nr:hypothetical protein AQUCO_00900022v1 [Aquilegia coerulea]